MAEHGRSLSGAHVLGVVFGVALLAAAGYFVWYLMKQEEPVPGPPRQVATQEEDDAQPPPDDGKPEKPIKTSPNRKEDTKVVDPVGRQGKPTSLAGVVVDPEGNPIKGAVVQRFRYSWEHDPTKRIVERFHDLVLESQDTQDDGRYEFKDLVPGDRSSLRALAPGYVPQIKDYVKVGLVVDFTLQPGSMVLGKVTDRDSGMPVKGALIRGYYKTGSSVSDVNKLFRWSEIVRTDDEGRYRFEGVPGAKVKFLLFHDEYEDLVEDHEVALERTNEIDFQMKRGLVIKGMVLNKLNDEPIEGCRVQVLKLIMPITEVKTDDEGRFTIKGIERTMYAFNLVKEGFTFTRKPRKFTDDDGYDPERDNQIIFRIDPAGGASGTVVDPDGNPVEGARVFVAQRNPLNYKVRNKAETRSAPDGTFLVNNLGAGANNVYRIAAHKPGFVIGVSEDISVAPEEIHDGVVVKLRRGCTIRGYVRDEVQAPVPGAVVTVERPPFMDVWFMGQDLGQQGTETLVTSDDGSFELSGIWRGSYEITITHPDHVPLEKQRILIKEPDEVVNRDFTLRIGRYIAGTVTTSGPETAEGAVVTAMRMWMEKAEGTATVDEEGHFRISGLVKGIYRVQARKPGYSSQMMFNVASDTGNVALHLEAQGELSGFVTGPTGAPVERFTVTLIPDSGQNATPEMRKVNMRRGRTESFYDRGGRFHIERVDAGRYSVSVSSPHHMTETLRDVLVPAGGAGNVGSVRLEKGAAISGYVKDPQGIPVGDAVITAHNRDLAAAMRKRGEKPVGPPASAVGEKGDLVEGGGSRPGQVTWSTRPDATGHYLLGGLPEGTYVLRVQSARHVPPSEAEIRVRRNQEVRRDFVLPLASSVVLTVTDDLSEPVIAAMANVIDAVSGARVRLRAPARSNARGVLTVSQLPPGHYKVRVWKSGFLAEEIEVQLGSGATVRRSVRLNKLR